jgi:hypothetical protein
VTLSSARPFEFSFVLMERSGDHHRPQPYHRGEVHDEAHRRLREEVPALKEKKMKVAHGFHKVPQTGVICT